MMITSLFILLYSNRKHLEFIFLTQTNKSKFQPAGTHNFKNMHLLLRYFIYFFMALSLSHRINSGIVFDFRMQVLITYYFTFRFCIPTVSLLKFQCRALEILFKHRIASPEKWQEFRNRKPAPHFHYFVIGLSNTGLLFVCLRNDFVIVTTT